MKRRIALGFAVAAVLLATLVTLVGWRDVVADLSGADPRLLAASIGSGLLALTFRGLVWLGLLKAVDESMTRIDVASVFLSAMFIKYVTPYGQVATEPFVAYLVSRDAEMAYEDGLAGILSADLLNYIPYYTLGFLAMGWIVAVGAMGADIHSYLFAFLTVFLVLVTISFVVVRVPTVVYRIVLGAASVLQRPIGVVASGIAAKLAADVVRDRLDGFYRSVDVISADRRMLVTSTLYAHLGMVFLMLPVYLGGLAIGYEIAAPVVVLAVALGKLGAFVPAPGGLGGVEASVTVALILLAGLGDASALTVALIYRISTYWLTIALGGCTAFAFVVRR